MADGEKKSGCGKAAGIGCLVIVLLACIGGYLAVTNWPKLFVFGASAMLEGLQLPPEEKEAALAPVREMAEKIKKGEITGQQGEAMARALAEGPLFLVIMLRATEVNQMKSPLLPPDEQAALHTNVTRLAQGLFDGRVARTNAEEVLSAVYTTTRKPGGGIKVEAKSPLTPDQQTTFIAAVKKAADDAGIEDLEFKIDIAAEIRKVINAGLNAPPAPPAASNAPAPSQ
jgi:hypothetical protein